MGKISKDRVKVSTTRYQSRKRKFHGKRKQDIISTAEITVNNPVNNDNDVNIDTVVETTAGHTADTADSTIENSKKKIETLRFEESKQFQVID